MKAVQKPRIDIHAPYKSTDGKECIYLTSAYGYVPDKWQELVLNRWLATDSKGAYLHRTCCLSVPRQNGKNAILEMIELYKTLVQGRKILHTAHEVKTCRKAFLRLKEFFEGGKYPELEEEVVAMRSTNGQEAIIFKNEASIEFISRSKRSGRGFTVDDVILDEAQELEDEQMEAVHGATPIIEYEEGAKPLAKEIETARKLANQGIRLKFRKEINEQKERTSDVFVVTSNKGNPVYTVWDFKEPSSGAKNTVSNQFKEIKEQAHKMVLDLNTTEEPFDKVLKKVEWGIFARYDRYNIDEVLIVDKEGSLHRVTRDSILRKAKAGKIENPYAEKE